MRRLTSTSVHRPYRRLLSPNRFPDSSHVSNGPSPEVDWVRSPKVPLQDPSRRQSEVLNGFKIWKSEGTGVELTSEDPSRVLSTPLSGRTPKSTGEDKLLTAEVVLELQTGSPTVGRPDTPPWVRVTS